MNTPMDRATAPHQKASSEHTSRINPLLRRVLINQRAG